MSRCKPQQRLPGPSLSHRQGPPLQGAWLVGLFPYQRDPQGSRMCLNPHPSVPITLNLPLLTPKSKSCCRQLAVPEALLPAEALKTLPLPSSCTAAAPRVTTTVVPSCLGQLKNSEGTSLVVQWLRLRLPLQGLQVQSLVGKLRSHMLCSQKIRT